MRRRLPTILAGFVVGSVALLSIFPLYWMFKTSLEPSQIVVNVPPTILPREPTFDNFVKLFTTLPMDRWFFNSTFVTAVRTVATLLFAAMAGYAFAKLRFWGRDAIFWSMLLVVMIPGFLTFLPLYRLMREIGWYDTYLALIVPGISGGAWAMFLMRQFIRTLPSELIESARMDGASEPAIFFRIILPLSTPGLAVLGIFTFMGNWNNLIWPLLVIEFEGALPIDRRARLHQERFCRIHHAGRHLAPDGGLGRRRDPDDRGVHLLPALLPAGRDDRSVEGVTASSPTRVPSPTYSAHPWEVRLGVVWRIAERLGILAALSLAWILALATIVLVPVATAAILRFALARARGRSPSVLGELLAGVRESWRRAVVLGFVSALVSGLLAADLWFLSGQSTDLAMLFRGAVTLLAAWWILVSIHIWPLVGGTGMSAARILRVSVGLTLVELPWSVATAVVLAGALLALSIVPPAMILLGPGLLAAIWGRLAWRAIGRHLEPGELDG